jgi:diacylglycerol kinase (ATP)
MAQKRIRFIINPRSGVIGKHRVPEMIDQFLDQQRFEHEILFTTAPKHATELSRQAAGKSYDLVIAVGGDGSVNEVAKGLLGTNTALGILPMGSGNGMARHLKIPMDIQKAIGVINGNHRERIDTIAINDEFCIGTFGVGFDAHVAHLFAAAKTRGYSTYVKLTLSEFYKYKALHYELVVDDKAVTAECFLLTFANSSQFGNNAVIAPFADVKDGIIDISMMKSFAAYLAPHLIYRLMNNSIHKSRFFSMLKGRSILIKNNGTLKGHIDGEAVTFTTDVHVKIVPASLDAVVPATIP